MTHRPATRLSVVVEQRVDHLPRRPGVLARALGATPRPVPIDPTWMPLATPMPDHPSAVTWIDREVPPEQRWRYRIITRVHPHRASAADGTV